MTRGHEQASPAPRSLLVLAAASVSLYFLWDFLSLTFDSKHTSAMASRSPISVLSLSQNRTVVRAIHEHINSHGYAISGILESNPYAPSELALALKVLEPRPQVVLMGRGYSDEEASSARQVFSQYMKEVGLDKGTVVKITSKVFEEVGKDGVPKWVLGQLETYFGK